MIQDQLTALAEGQVWAPLGGLLIGMLLSLSPVSLPGVAAALAFVAGMDGILCSVRLPVRAPATTWRATDARVSATVTCRCARAFPPLFYPPRREGGKKATEPAVMSRPAPARRRTAGVRPRLALLTGQRDTPDARPGVHSGCSSR
jgi:hypothetical protein